MFLLLYFGGVSEIIGRFRLDDIADDTADNVRFKLVLVRRARVRTLHEGHIYVADPKTVNCMRWAMLTHAYVLEQIVVVDTILGNAFLVSTAIVAPLGHGSQPILRVLKRRGRPSLNKGVRFR